MEDLKSVTASGSLNPSRFIIPTVTSLLLILVIHTKGALLDLEPPS